MGPPLCVPATEKDHTPHTHGGTDAPECTPYGVPCQPPCDVRNTGYIGVLYCRTHDETWRRADHAACPAVVVLPPGQADPS